MCRWIAFLCFTFVGPLAIECSIAVAQQGDPEKPKFGLSGRVPWTTSKVVGTPEPPPPYTTELAFPKLPKFEEPLDLAQAPGSKRLFIAGRGGKIWSFINERDVAKADLALELAGMNAKGDPMKQYIYSITFNRRADELYVTWMPNPEAQSATGMRVSKFTVKGEPPIIDRASEKVIIEWPNIGHKGGCIRFTKSCANCLYIGIGDGSGIADERRFGQDLGTINAKILRINVQNPDPGKGYSIPKSNPFVARRGAREETWAYGLRQPWRFSFDHETSHLWCGDVGQDLWEMIYRIEKGGNYGWSVMEGTHPFRPDRKKGPTPILRPIVEHSHTDFRSITGGYVYHGKRLPELAKQYVYGDFDTGRIWAFTPIILNRDVVNDFADREFKRRDLNEDGRLNRDEMPAKLWENLNSWDKNGDRVIDRNEFSEYYAERMQEPRDQREIARTTHRIVSFGEDAERELYILDFTSGRIYQLAKGKNQ